jgi:hypothetical protein
MVRRDIEIGQRNRRIEFAGHTATAGYRNIQWNQVWLETAPRMLPRHNSRPLYHSLKA